MAARGSGVDAPLMIERDRRLTTREYTGKQMITIRWAPLQLFLFLTAFAGLFMRTAGAQVYQPAVPPTNYQLDGNGVDLATGEFFFGKGVDLSIGPDGPQGLTYSSLS